MSLVIVTGAGRGIGRAVSRAFVERGFEVALLARSQRELETVAEELRVLGGTVWPLVCDVAQASSVENAIGKAVALGGPPQAVVNNAGIVRRASVQSMEEADWDTVIDINLKGPFLVTRACMPHMIPRRSGRFIQVGSISSTLGTPRLSAYCASKWGLVGFTKSLAEELRGSGLQAMSILPGSVDTDMLKGSGFAPAMTPEDVAGVIVYAALDAPDAANGSSFEVFGP